MAPNTMQTQPTTMYATPKKSFLPPNQLVVDRTIAFSPEKDFVGKSVAAAHAADHTTAHTSPHSTAHQQTGQLRMCGAGDGVRVFQRIPVLFWTVTVIVSPALKSRSKTPHNFLK